MLRMISRLKMGQQLGLIVVALLVPLSYVGVQYALGLNARIHEQAMADTGLRYVHELKEGTGALAEHAAFTSAVLAGDTNSAYFDPRIRAASEKVDQAFAAQEVQEGIYGTEGSPERTLWSEIKTDWLDLKTGWKKLEPEVSGARHDALSAKLTRLVHLIAESHHLDRDSDLNQAYLQDVAVLKVPRLSTDLGRLRADAAPIAAQMSAVTQDQEAAIYGLLGDVHSVLDDTEWKIRALSAAPKRASGSQEGSATDVLEVVKAELSEYEKWLRGNILTRRPVALATEEVMEHGAKLETQLAALHALLTVDVEARSAKRLAAGELERTIAFVVVGAMVLAAIALALGITRRVVRSLATAGTAFSAIAHGNFNHSISTQSKDELGDLLRSLAVMQKTLKDRVEADQLALAESLRVRQALDTAGSVVLVADEAHRIVFANQAAVELFHSIIAEAPRELRAAAGQTLVGATLEMFSAVPQLAKPTIESLRGSSTSVIVLGSFTLVLTATPVIDRQGARLGTVLEWRNRSAEVAVESEVQDVVAKALDGRLDVALSATGRSEFHAALAMGLNSMIDNTGNILRTLRSSASLITESVERIMRGNSELSGRTEQQASSLEETASAMEEMTVTVRQNADAVQQADGLALSAKDRAADGRSVVARAVGAMGEIRHSSEKIRDIIGVIDEIAFQTNLLALNAAVEAARAGEQGRGFAVVAAEVRNLAGRSSEAAKQIKALISDSVSRVVDGAELVEQSGRSLDGIVEAVDALTQRVAQIAAASREQSRGIEEVNKAITTMDRMTQENASLVHEDASEAERLTGLVRELSKLVARYQLRGDPSGASPMPQAVVREVRGRRVAGAS